MAVAFDATLWQKVQANIGDKIQPDERSLTQLNLNATPPGPLRQALDGYRDAVCRVVRDFHTGLLQSSLAATRSALQMLSDNAGHSLATATALWVAGSPYSTVAATVGGVARTVKIYHGPNQAPNLVVDQVFPVHRVNGEWIADGSVLDAPLNAVRMWVGTAANIPRGWEEITGLREKFPRGVASAASAAGTGGSDSHDHGGNTGTAGGGTITDSAGVSGTTDSGTTGITIDSATVDAHPADNTGMDGAHIHEIEANGAASEKVINGVDDLGRTVENGDHTHTTPELTHAAHTHTVTDAGHTHTFSGTVDVDITIDSHSHTISSASNIPAYYTVFFIKRVMNV